MMFRRMACSSRNKPLDGRSAYAHTGKGTGADRAGKRADIGKSKSERGEQLICHRQQLLTVPATCLHRAFAYYFSVIADGDRGGCCRAFKCKYLHYFDHTPFEALLIFS